MSLDTGAWQHRVSTGDGNIPLQLFSCEENSWSGEPANGYSIFILLNQHRPQGCPRAALSRITNQDQSWFPGCHGQRSRSGHRRGQPREFRET